MTLYLLNVEHKDGGSKARFFLNRGFTLEEWEFLAQALRQHGRNQRVTEIIETRHGPKYIVECQVETPDGKNPCILSVWIKEGMKPMSFVTAYPNS